MNRLIEYGAIAGTLTLMGASIAPQCYLEYERAERSSALIDSVGVGMMDQSLLYAQEMERHGDFRTARIYYQAYIGSCEDRIEALNDVFPYNPAQLKWRERIQTAEERIAAINDLADAQMVCVTPSTRTEGDTQNELLQVINTDLEAWMREYNSASSLIVDVQ